MKYLGYFTIILFLGVVTAFPGYAQQTATQTDSWQELNGCDIVNIPVNNAFPNRDWWKQFNDDKLDNYISVALANNFSLRAANDRIAQSRAIVQEVKSIQRPLLGLGTSYQRIRTSSNVSTQESSSGARISGGKSVNLYTFPLQASYELDLFGQNRLKVKSAQKFSEEVTQESKVVELSISSEVAAAYLNLLQADASIKTTEALIDNASQSVQLRQQLFTGGVIPYDTVLLTEQDLSQYRESLAQYRSQRALFAHELDILTGNKPRKVDNVERLNLDQVSLPKDVPVGVPSELVTHRPDVEVVELAMQQANIDVKEARREFFPSVNLTGEFGFQAITLSNWFDWSSRIYQLGGAALQSLYTGGFKTANLKYKKAVAQEQLNNYYTVLLSAFGDVENSLALLKDNYAEYRENLAEIENSTHYTNLAQVRYKSGVGTRLDYLDAQRQLLTYQLLAQQNKARSLINLVSLCKALGGGYTP